MAVLEPEAAYGVPQPEHKSFLTRYRSRVPGLITVPLVALVITAGDYIRG
jgi:hypothetical protein